MATATEEKVEALQFCPDGSCLGYAQEKCEGIKTVVSQTFGDVGIGTATSLPGDANFQAMEYRSSEYVAFPDGEEPTCRHCGERLHITLETREVYKSPNVQRPRESDEISPTLANTMLSQEREMGDLKAQLAALTARQEVADEAVAETETETAKGAKAKS